MHINVARLLVSRVKRNIINTRNLLENYLIELGFSKDNITIQDGANDQATQSNQIDAFIADGVDLLIINPVNSSSAESITDKVVAANIPLVYVNREPGEDEEKRWEDNGWNVTRILRLAHSSVVLRSPFISANLKYSTHPYTYS